MASIPSTADVIEHIKVDYARFPQAQKYDLYAEDVYFQDPMNQFRGVARYRRMIGFIERWFQQIDLELRGVDQPQPEVIITRWTLNFTAPTPGQPRISIPGWSELTLNSQGLICSHIDYWDCSRWAVVKQMFGL